MKRLFIAIKIIPNQNFLDIFNVLKKELEYEKINWVDESNLHFTLKFLGKTENSQIEKIISNLKKITAATQVLNIRIENLGVFGSRYDPRVIWAGIASNEQLSQLAEKVLNKLDEVGFKRDRQNFVPHITLGRIKHIRDKKHLKKVIDKNRTLIQQEEQVKKIYLYESILKPEGPHYKVVKSFDLQNET
jgi:2'-5' RNA ligase